MGHKKDKKDKKEIVTHTNLDAAGKRTEIVRDLETGEVTQRRADAPEVENKNKDEPWISNYPPLYDWLMTNDARCDWQMRYGKGRQGFMLEQWRMPGSLPFIVLVFTQMAGWEIFTPCASAAVDETLADAKARVYPGATEESRGVP